MVSILSVDRKGRKEDFERGLATYPTKMEKLPVPVRRGHDQTYSEERRAFNRSRILHLGFI